MDKVIRSEMKDSAVDRQDIWISSLELFITVFDRDQMIAFVGVMCIHEYNSDGLKN